jgi:uncharacterized protein
MSLLLAMLPVYLLGNVHCAGMCGPLVMFLGRHRYRYGYFIGRIVSFSIAGLIAGSLGALVNVGSKALYLSVILSFFIAIIMFLIGFKQFFSFKIGSFHVFRIVQTRISTLMLQDRLWPTFLFGVCTVLLPCGQSLMVFSACALWGDPFVGWINGFVFALLTSPSLFFAMQAHRFFKKKIVIAHRVIALFTLGIGILSLCRGLAELNLIPHFILNDKYHIVMY